MRFSGSARRAAADTVHHICTVIERTIAATTHGRYLVEPAAGSAPAPMLVGCHGYAEAAEEMLGRLRAIPGAEGWLLVSIQGLNRFYQRRTNDVIAGWMTRQDRDLAIADNVAYVSAIVDTAAREFHAAPQTVFAGFSQGVAMAFRGAAASGRDVRGVIAAGGDIPPEIDAASLGRIRAAMVSRGSRDEWYTDQKFATDRDRLRSAGVDVSAVAFDGGHEWSPDVIRAAAGFLDRCR
jgi:predicted esterase